jgi:dihydroxyacid dehydratase/phosphogluconate dehydratase
LDFIWCWRGRECALITDGRFRAGTHNFCAGHVAPEALDGGPIALVEFGDEIRIVVTTNGIDLLASEEELAQRAMRVKPITPRYSTGVLETFARQGQGRIRARSRRPGSLLVSAPHLCLDEGRDVHSCHSGSSRQ